MNRGLPRENAEERIRQGAQHDYLGECCNMVVDETSPLIVVKLVVDIAVNPPQQVLLQNVVSDKEIENKDDCQNYASVRRQLGNLLVDDGSQTPVSVLVVVVVLAMATLRV